MTVATADVRHALAIAGVIGYYGKIAAVRDVSLRVARGGAVGLIGPNGAGKTTLLKAIAGLVRASGTIELDGTRIDRQRSPRRFRLGIALVAQERNAVAGLTVAENLRLSWLVGRRLTPFHERIERTLAMFPQLQGRLDLAAGALSGGQRQMLAVSRGLAGDPSVLLLDEPTAGLAPVVVGELTEALVKLRAQGVTMLLAEQNLYVAKRVCDDANVLTGGRVVWQGPTGKLTREMAGSLYLSDAGEDP
jgi:branched-chain amino acid transport system ATP-binding protein